MVIALLADIHGNLTALKAVLADLAGRNVDRIVTLGDHLSGPLLPRETADLLMAQDWLHIAGNHERQLLSFDMATAGPSDRYTHPHLTQAHWTWLRSLPAIAELDREVFLCHGSPRSDLEYLFEEVDAGRVHLAGADEIGKRLTGVTAPVVVCGHSHLPRLLRSRRGQLLINPGSVGLPAYDDTGMGGYHVVETGSPDARYAILEKRSSGWTATLHAVPYDSEATAKLADKNARPDWAHALRTGYVRARGT